MSTQNYSDLVKQKIKETFPGAFNVPFQPAARFAGFASQTARNKLLDGTFPLRSVKQGGRRFITVLELTRYLVAQACGDAADPTPTATDTPCATPQSPRRGRGRPCKIPAAARQGGAK